MATRLPGEKWKSFDIVFSSVPSHLDDAGSHLQVRGTASLMKNRQGRQAAENRTSASIAGDMLHAYLPGELCRSPWRIAIGRDERKWDS